MVYWDRSSQFLMPMHFRCLPECPVNKVRNFSSAASREFFRAGRWKFPQRASTSIGCAFALLRRGLNRQPSTPHHRGTVVALAHGMSRLLSATASMICPLCGRRVAPTADSTWVLAWYDCPNCGHVWSARIRNGLPDMPLAGDACLDLLPNRERP